MNTARHHAGVVITDDGRAAFAGLPLQLHRKMEESFRQMALQNGAEERAFPNLIDNRILRRAGYFGSFPDGATAVDAPGLSHDCSLAPAVCYHCYSLFSEERPDRALAWTCQGRCYRHEKGRYEGLARLWEFTMREIVFCGPEEWVGQQLAEWKERVLAFCALHALAGHLEESTDPFYGAASRGQQLLQRLKKLKYELRLNLADGSTTAAASFNFHETHFAQRFGITSSAGAQLHTGCVAFGIERWVLAALEQWDAARLRQFST